MDEKNEGDSGQAIKVAEHHLVVAQAFGNYRKGDMISDVDEVADILAGDNKHHVNKVRAS